MSQQSMTHVRTNLSYLIPICLVATLGGLLFGYDTGVISGAIESLTSHFDLGSTMKGWVSGCVLIGCAVGVLIVGPISDRWGRKKAMVLAGLLFLVSSIGTAIPDNKWAMVLPGLLFLVSSIGTAISDNKWIFIAFRFLGGLGIGIASMSTPMYIAEITPANLRGRMVAVNQIAIVSGMVVVAFVNYFIAGLGNQDWNIAMGWRLMFAIGIVPSVAFLLLLLPIPESPRWLAENGREDQAVKILARVGGDEFARAEIHSIRESLAAEQGTWAELFSRRMRLPLLLGVALAVLQQVTGINAFLYFGATIFKEMSSSTGVDAGLLEQIVINGAGMLSTVVAIATVDLWGRRPLMILGSAGMGVSLLAMGIMAQRMEDPAAATHTMMALIIVYIACFGLSVGPVTWVILSEIFPTSVRGRALGLATFWLWMSDFAVTQTFPMMNDKDSWFVAHFQHAFPFYVYAAFCVVLFFVVWLWVPETKGRSLEEIEKSWR
jgi:sugar porter (SP) family MFS transporter